MNSGLGEVNAWCTAVHLPAPTATSPDATAAAAGSNIGASTTQQNAQSLGLIRPVRWPISTRAAPSSARDGVFSPAAKKMQSPGLAPTASARPARSVSVRFLATGTGEFAVLLEQDVGQALGAALLGPFLPGVERPAGLRGAAGHDDGTDVGRP